MSVRPSCVQFLNALQYGLLLFLVAAGLTLIFGIMGVINLAHGSFYMIGAYMAFALAPASRRTRLGILRRARPRASCSRSLLGYVLEWAFFSFLYERDHLQQVLHDLRADPGLRGAAQHARRRRRARRAAPGVLAGIVPLTRHADLSGLPPVHVGGVPRAGARHVSRDLSDAARHDDPRRRVEPRDGRSRSGIDIKFLYRVVFAAGVALAVLAGMIAAPVSSVYPGHGQSGAHHLLRGGGDRRHRLGARRAARGAAGRHRRHLRQGAACRRPPGVLVYVLMALVLLWKPDGLFKAT